MELQLFASNRKYDFYSSQLNVGGREVEIHKRSNIFPNVCFFLTLIL